MISFLFGVLAAYFITGVYFALIIMSTYEVVSHRVVNFLGIILLWPYILWEDIRG